MPFFNLVGAVLLLEQELARARRVLWEGPLWTVRARKRWGQRRVLPKQRGITADE